MRRRIAENKRSIDGRRIRGRRNSLNEHRGTDDYTKAFRDGYDQGYEDGYHDGYDDGFADIDIDKSKQTPMRKKTLKKESKRNGKTFEVDEKGYSEVGFFGTGTQKDAFDFAKNNGEGWRLPTEKEAKRLARIYNDDLEENSIYDIDYIFWIDKEGWAFEADGYDGPDTIGEDTNNEDIELLFIR